MTIPEDQKKFAGKRRLEQRGLEGDELLNLCGLDKDPNSSCFFFFLFIPLKHLSLKMHVVYALFLTGCTCYGFSQA